MAGVSGTQACDAVVTTACPGSPFSVLGTGRACCHKLFIRSIADFFVALGIAGIIVPVSQHVAYFRLKHGSSASGTPQSLRATPASLESGIDGVRTNPRRTEPDSGRYSSCGLALIYYRQALELEKKVG